MESAKQILKNVTHFVGDVIEFGLPTMDVSRHRVPACSAPPRPSANAKAKDPNIIIREGRAFRREGDTDTRVHVNGRMPVLTQRDREQLCVAGLDETKAAEIKTFWAQGLSTNATSQRVVDPMTGKARNGYSERSLDPYWSAFNTAERVGGNPSPTEREDW